VINNDREYILEEEFLLVRHSGEIPEVALHASLYYLCEDEDGPRLLLSDEELKPLEGAVLERYQEIILRDLDVTNRDLSLFRGVNRAICNWYRFIRFSAATGNSCHDFREKTAMLLISYLQREVEDVHSGKRISSINCSADALTAFFNTLGIDVTALPGDWSCLCQETS
jgi:hypothetical protein